MKEKAVLLRKAYVVFKQEGLKSLFFKTKLFLRKKKLPFPQYNIENYFFNTAPIPVFFDDFPAIRLNIVTDSLFEKSVFGGVATSIVFAALLANKINCNLRIITRDGYSASVLVHLAEKHNITLPKIYELRNIPINVPEVRLPVGKNDIFIATSWWSCCAIKDINMRKKYIYILQEYEKIFYPKGDEHVLIDGVFKDSRMLPVVNTKLLYDFFKNNDYNHIADSALFFEPAFPYVETNREFARKAKYNLMFYARPNMPRNLYRTGLMLLNRAIKAGVIDTKIWQIYFAGQEINPSPLIDGTMPNFLGKMKIDDYAKLIPQVDLAISLMCAPCPSYPPLDLSASGAVVLTNQYKNKTSLASYSKNIICAELSDDSLFAGLKQALSLAKNLPERERNYNANSINKSWNDSFSEVITVLSEQINKGII